MSPAGGVGLACVLGAAFRTRWVGVAPAVALLPWLGGESAPAHAVAVLAAVGVGWRREARGPAVVGLLAHAAGHVLPPGGGWGWLVVGGVAAVPALVEARWGVPRIDWVRLAAVTVPVHLGLAVGVAQAWARLGPDVTAQAVLWLHAAALGVLVGTWRWWRGQEAAVVAVVVLDHCATLGLGALLWR